MHAAGPPHVMEHRIAEHTKHLQNKPEQRAPIPVLPKQLVPICKPSTFFCILF